MLLLRSGGLRDMVNLQVRMKLCKEYRERRRSDRRKGIIDQIIRQDNEVRAMQMLWSKG